MWCPATHLSYLRLAGIYGRYLEHIVGEKRRQVNTRAIIPPSSLCNLFPQGLKKPFSFRNPHGTRKKSLIHKVLINCHEIKIRAEFFSLISCF